MYFDIKLTFTEKKKIFNQPNNAEVNVNTGSILNKYFSRVQVLPSLQFSAQLQNNSFVNNFCKSNSVLNQIFI